MVREMNRDKSFINLAKINRLLQFYIITDKFRKALYRKKSEIENFLNEGKLKKLKQKKR